MGDVFLRASKMIVIPLIFFSMLSGVTNLGGSVNHGPIGIRTLVYYLGKTFLAIAVQKDILEVAIGMGQYILVVVSGLALHVLVGLPLVMYLTAGTHPFRHYRRW